MDKKEMLRLKEKAAQSIMDAEHFIVITMNTSVNDKIITTSDLAPASIKDTFTLIMPALE